MSVLQRDVFLHVLKKKTSRKMLFFFFRLQKLDRQIRQILYTKNFNQLKG